jgi:RNA-directed DNA polymerase
MNETEWVARNLAAALLAGRWTRRGLLKRAEAVLGRKTRKSQQALVQALVEGLTTAYPPSPYWLVAFLLQSPAFKRAAGGKIKDPLSVKPVLQEAKFAPAPRFSDLAVPRLPTPGDLAEWLQLSINQLDWLSDAKRQQGSTDIPILQHYRYAFVPKKTGAPRLIEIPKPKLMAIQRRILHEILDLVPTHDSAHGFVSGRSCLSAAQVHAGESIVVTVDLKDFFLNTRLSRVHNIFRSLGYPWAVARALTGLCSSCTPRSVFSGVPIAQRHDWMTQKIYQSPHLPQGAPTSPALANLAAWHLDVRVRGLAKTFGANYTRYADDLAFSGDRDFALKIKPFLAAIADIAKSEGFTLNDRKTRIMRRGGCQRVTGIVVNDHINVPRPLFDELKATLHNCRRNGPAAENRAGLRDFHAHLNGKVTWVEQVNPARGERLRRMFNEIKW